MRFDFFEEFWKNYEEELAYFNASKEEVKSFYDTHCSRLKPNGEEISPYLRKGVGYTDMSNNQKYNSFVEGYVYVMPVNFKMFQVYNCSGVSFSRNFESVSIKDGNLIIEEYNPNTAKSKITGYDSDATKYIIDQGKGSWDNIDYIEERIRELQLFPDVEVVVTRNRENRQTKTRTYQVEKYKNGELVSSDFHEMPAITSCYANIIGLVDYDQLLSQSKSK